MKYATAITAIKCQSPDLLNKYPDSMPGWWNDTKLLQQPHLIYQNLVIIKQIINIDNAVTN